MPTTYEIQLTDGTHAKAVSVDDDAAISTWKKAPVSDKLFIVASGRNIHSRPLNSYRNVIYRILDHSTPRDKRRKPPEVVVYHDNLTDKVSGVIAQHTQRSRKTKILINAIVATDKEYCRCGGGVFYRDPFHKYPAMVNALYVLFHSKEMTI